MINRVYGVSIPVEVSESPLNVRFQHQPSPAQPNRRHSRIMILRLSPPASLIFLLLLLLCTPAKAAEADADVISQRRIDQGIDWDNCAPGGTQPPKPSFIPAARSEVIYLEADDALLDQTHKQLHLTGEARVRKGATYLEADELTYHQGERSADLLGAIYLEQPGLRVTGETGWLALDSQRGWLSGVAYRLPETQARGTAARAEMLSEGLFHYTQVSYTTCPPDTNDCCLLYTSDAADERG